MPGGQAALEIGFRTAGNDEPSKRQQDAALVVVESYLGERAFATRISDWQCVALLSFAERGLI